MSIVANFMFCKTFFYHTSFPNEHDYDDINVVFYGFTVYVPIDAHCASADLRVRVYFKKKKKII